MKYFLAIILALAMVTTCFAADVKHSWDAVPGASSYKVYISTDLGATWTSGISVGNVTTYTYTNVPDNALVLFKIGVIAPNGAESKMDWSGDWWDSRKKPLDAPYGLGVK